MSQNLWFSLYCVYLRLTLSCIETKIWVLHEVSKFTECKSSFDSVRIYVIIYNIKEITINLLSDCNWTRTQNHLVLKRTLNHLAKLTKRFSLKTGIYGLRQSLLASLLQRHWNLIQSPSIMWRTDYSKRSAGQSIEIQ